MLSAVRCSPQKTPPPGVREVNEFIIIYAHPFSADVLLSDRPHYFMLSHCGNSAFNHTNISTMSSPIRRIIHQLAINSFRSRVAECELYTAQLRDCRSRRRRTLWHFNAQCACCCCCCSSFTCTFVHALAHILRRTHRSQQLRGTLNLRFNCETSGAAHLPCMRACALCWRVGMCSVVCSDSGMCMRVGKCSLQSTHPRTAYCTLKVNA